MPRPRSKSDHSSRTGAREDGSVTCACGAEFPSDQDWRRHYESKTTAKERERIEGRDSDDG